MSETQTQQPAEEYVPHDVLSAEDNEDATRPLQPPPEQPRATPQEAADGAEDKPQADDAEEQRKSERRREAQRIGYLTKQRYAEKARADALEQRLRDYEQQLNGGAPRQPTQQEFEALVDQRADQKIAAEQLRSRFNEWHKVGGEEFGEKKFQDAATVVGEIAGERGVALRDVLMDTEGSQRAIMEMADNPEEAERILALPPHRQALAIAKLGAAPAAPPPRPVSNLSPPIRPPTAGRARGEPDPEKGDMGSFERWSAKQQWRR